MPTSRSSVSSVESEGQNNSSQMFDSRKITMTKRWATLETMGRCMFLFSVAFFIIGVLLTVFGFSNAGIKPPHQLPLQILGPVCLMMTMVMWILGCVFSRLWNLEWKRQQQAAELRDRVQIHALAMDILNNPVISPALLQDPRLRRQLLLKLRAQRAFDMRSMCSSEPDSRRPSRAQSSTSRRQSSVQYDKYIYCDTEGPWSRKSSEVISNGDKLFKGMELPGIQISRFETLDLSNDGKASVCSHGSKRYIVIHSDVPNEFSKLSCPSDYSLAGSRSSKSRSSRASSGVSSRLWDFSPRDSEWDADISLGSRESQLSVIKQDWGGGPSYGNDVEYMLSPNTPRKSSVVTFDMGSPSVRRHSSPASAVRRKDSGCECTCSAKKSSQQQNSSQKPIKGVLVNGNRNHSEDLTANGQSRIAVMNAFRKRSMEQSFKSLTIEEDEPEILEESTPLTERQNETSSVFRPNVYPSKPPLRRNNTDDSEVERRVAKLFREIELSTSDSVDECKIQNFSNFSSDFNDSARRVDVREAQIQTLTELEFEAMVKQDESNLPSSESNKMERVGSRPVSVMVLSSGCDSAKELLDSKNIKLKEKRSRFAKLSSAFSTIGATLVRDKKVSLVPVNLLSQGISSDDIHQTTRLN